MARDRNTADVGAPAANVLAGERERARSDRARAGALLAICAVVVAGCGAPATPARSRAETPTSPPLTVATGASTIATERCVEPTRQGVGERQRGVDALLAGRPQEANAIFERVLAATPGDLGAETLRIAATSNLGSANAKAARELESVPLVRLASLPLTQSTPRRVAFGGRTPLQLEKVSLAKNLITDDAAWLKRNGLTPMNLRPRPEDIPEFVAARLRGAALSRLFVHADHQIGLYGNVLGVFAPEKRPRAFDLSGIVRTDGGVAMEVDFAQVVGDVLLLQLSHNGYAKEVHGKHAFVAALDLDSGALDWSSEPLVGNAQNFLVVGGDVIAGYGFTAEPDALFVLDITSGMIEQKVPLASGPTWILRKGDQVFVRTYDTDVVFRLPAGAPPAPSAGLGDEVPEAGAVTDAETRCLVDGALAAIDARDPSALGVTIEKLRRRGIDETLARALSGAQTFLAQRASHPGIDLGSRPIVVPEAPTWEHSFRGAASSTPPKAPRLVKLSEARADPVRTLRRPATVDPSKPIFLAPVEKGRLPQGARGDIPSTFGVEDLRAVIPSGDRLILVYGGRYVAIVNGTTTESVLDLEAYRHPPKADPQWAEFAVEDVTYALVAGTTLYVANGGGSYAREVYGKKGFMSAIDLPTGKLLWRSDPLVAGSTFDLTPEYVAVGYGFTDEPDFVFLLRRDDGTVATKARVSSAPSEVTVAGDRLHVETYSGTYDFEIRP